MKNIQPPSGIRAEIEKLLYEFDPGGYVEEIDLAKWEALIAREKKAAVEKALEKVVLEEMEGVMWSVPLTDEEKARVMSEMFPPAPHADQ